MTLVFFWAFLFSLTTAVSIVLLGSREFFTGEMSLAKIFSILFHWKFILGAILAFGARLLFVLTNSAVYRIPELAASSTSITTLINGGAILVVILFNVIFLKETLNGAQILGGTLILIGIFLLTRL